MQSTEEKIISGCIRSEYKAQKLLYSTYYNSLMGICLRYCHTRDEAEDVLLIALYRIYKSIGKYNGSGSFEGWMKRIVVNAAIDNYRKNSKYYGHDNIDDLEDLAQESEPLPADLPIDEIRKAVNDLSPGYRLIFNLYSFEGYSHKEIANMLDITESTSKSQLRKARLILRKKLLALNLNGTEREDQ